ncbi:ABC transporter ATP-binding protein/permease [Clostridium estertheticum]|uniref:ABC transporter ATP-binding protein/permease n=1 Tax=Clostridium estertheticum TaxID=238834 RepID=A0AA47I568_9CLOT|nr:ABC transporter ATP-binding protein [Clostridium estertheticum]MBU3153938.1 ABC transporter ATP-binding protein/permease [Clostridium estertheticum]MBU3199317.1 ABC transporter ATP-binding protein/permease [Clostridium estertheticum]WAG58525.1 ABC transporter ATP-binding protein/permease [Clostridium estertheticum]WAG67437.1 ABC transporter ATP-binding protein/permease [Clostridium estertheticum]
MDRIDKRKSTQKIDIGIWRKLFKYLSEFKNGLIFLALLMVGVAGIDVVMPLLTKYAIDNFIVKKTIDGLPIFALVYFCVIVFQGLNVRLFIIHAGKIETHLAYHIRKIGFKRLQELSFSYYDTSSVGWLMARMTSDVTKLSEIISWGLIDMVWALVMMAGFIGVMLYNNVGLTLICMSVVPVLFLIGMYFQKKILKSYRVVRKFNSRLTADFSEEVSGAKTTKTLVREEENLKEFKLDAGKMRNSSVKAAVFSALFLPIVISMGSLGVGFVLWIGGEKIIAGDLSYGTFVMFIAYTVQFFDPINRLAGTIAELQNAQASAERIIGLIETKPDIWDSKDVIKKYGDLFDAKRENWEKIHGDIEFKDVCFTYKNGEKVFKNFNLKVNKGETIALVGETGSGKSTLVNLLCRFYEPSSGEILIDGIDYRKRSLLWLQSNIGYVLQSPHLFSGTIRDNIIYGKLNASILEIENAAKLVNAHNFISKLDKKYDTQVGEGGGNLSTGEKQLISFARAILANPALFVLDEATSSIDTETEKMIQNAIEKVLKSRTSFVVAHRLSTIVSADKILVIRNGNITESGNHRELLKKKGYYYSLYTNQLLEDKEMESKDILS